MTVTRRDDVALAGKNVRLDKLQNAVLADGRVGDDKQSVAKGFQLRSTVFFQGIFNGQFVQVELTLQIG